MTQAPRIPRPQAWLPLVKAAASGTLDPMSIESDAVLREALALPVDRRAEVAAELLASLDESVQDDPEAIHRAWAEELERRARVRSRARIQASRGRRFATTGSGSLPSPTTVDDPPTGRLGWTAERLTFPRTGTHTVIDLWTPLSTEAALRGVNPALGAPTTVTTNAGGSSALPVPRLD